MVFPAPVGPTRATLSPLFTLNERFSRIVLLSSYANVTLSKETSPFIGGISFAFGLSFTFTGSSSVSKIRSR